MSRMYSEISQILNATPEQINTLLSEYRDGFRAIAPQHYFLDMVRQDNNDSDNTVTVRMNLSGTVHQLEERVSEPIPLRIIVEFNTQIDTVIAIVVEETNSSDKTRVTISTIDANNPFLADFIGAMFVPASLTRLYNEESRNLTGQLRKLVTMPQAS